MAIENRKYK